LRIEGGCNVQLALDPHSFQYYIIEVNPRVSRSSALASKATGYPIAKIAAKIAVGLTLDEIKHPLTESTYANVEPALDYIVTKIPRFPFDKFIFGDRKLGTQMKATGEIMAIGRTFEESLLKGIRSLEVGNGDFHLPYLQAEAEEDLIHRLQVADDERMFIIAEMLRRGLGAEAIHEHTKIDYFFLNKFAGIIEYEKEMTKNVLETDVLQRAKRLGFSDEQLARIWQVDLEKVYEARM